MIAACFKPLEFAHYFILEKLSFPFISKIEVVLLGMMESSMKL